MKSALAGRLTQEQRVALTRYAAQRVKDLRGARDQQFLEPLKRWAAMAAGDYSWRQAGVNAPVELKTTFDRSNRAAQLVRSVARFLVARLNKDALSTDDYFKLLVDGAPSTPLEGNPQKHAEVKLRECEWKERAREALKTGLDLGFAVLKTTWREAWDVSERIDTVLTNGQEPIIGQDGDFFYPADDLQQASPGFTAAPGPDVDVELTGGTPEDGTPGTGGTLGTPEGGADSAGEEAQEGDTTGADDQPAQAPAPMGENVPQAPQAMVFAKDPSVAAPHPTNTHTFAPHLIEEPQRLFCGLHVSPVHWQDVVWPVNAAAMDLDDPGCDFIGHTRTMTLEELRAAYDPNDDNTEVQAVLARLQSADNAAKDEGSKPKTELRESEVRRTDDQNPAVKVTECYFRRRVLPSGPESRVFLCLIEQNGLEEALWFEYLARMSPRSAAPLHLVPLNKVNGRAYGLSLYQIYEIASEIVDLLINGVIVRNEEHANPIKAVNKSGLVSTATGGGLEIGPGRVLELKGQGLPLNQIFQHIELPDLDSRTWQLIEMFMQLIQTESGVTNAAQGDLSNLPSNGTATGVNSLLESSSVLHNYLLEEVRSGLRAPLRYAVQSLYFHQDMDETYEYADGQPKGVLTLNDASALKGLPMNVDILLTRARRQEEKDAAMAAIPLGQQFYALPPGMQQKLLPLYVQAFRANGIEQPEMFFPSVAEIQQTVQQQAMAAAAPGASPGPMPGGEQPPAMGGPDMPMPHAPANVVDGAFAA